MTGLGASSRRQAALLSTLLVLVWGLAAPHGLLAQTRDAVSPQHALSAGGVPNGPLRAADPSALPTQPVVLFRAPSSPRDGQLAGAVHVGGTDLDAQGSVDAEFGAGIELKGRVRGNTLVDVSFLRGWNPGASPVIRYGTHRSRGHVGIRTPRVALEAGEIRPTSMFSAIPVVADGVALDKGRGRFIGGIAVGRPKYFGGGWGGHLIQAKAGVGFSTGEVSVVATDFSRPLTSRSVRVTTNVAEDSELGVEESARAGVLLSREDRVRGIGLDSRWTRGPHRLTVGAGWLQASGISEQRGEGVTAHGTYAFSGRRASLHAQVRESPPAVAGMASLGDSASVGGKYKVMPRVGVTANGFWSDVSLVGQRQSAAAQGLATGVEFASGKTRLRAEGHYRELQFLTNTRTRSMSAQLRSAAGLFSVDGALEYGQSDDGRRDRRIANYRGRVSAEGDRFSVMVSGQYRDSGLSRPRSSIDLSGTLDWRDVSVEAGGGIAHSGLFGDLATFWSTVELPGLAGARLLLGVDYNRWSFASSPYLRLAPDVDNGVPQWRFTISASRSLALRLPVAK